MYRYFIFLFAFLAIPVSAEVVTLETIEWNGSANLLGFWNDVSDASTRLGLIEKKVNLADIPAGAPFAMAFLLLPYFARKRNHGPV